MALGFAKVQQRHACLPTMPACQLCLPANYASLPTMRFGSSCAGNRNGASNSLAYFISQKNQT
jgi:hypothetical protein